MFVTAALGFAEAVTADEILRTAFAAVTAGADAVITGRGTDTVRMLANEQIPVVGHLGFVPRKSTWIGSVRAVGKTCRRSARPLDRFLRLEDAGAFAVECELITAPVMAEINGRTGLVTISLGSGAERRRDLPVHPDICGESPALPRHARAFADLAALHRQVRSERGRALGAFRAAVAARAYPAEGETASLPEGELAAFRAALAKAGPAG